MLLKSTLLQLSGILGLGIFALPFLFLHSNIYFALIGLVVLTFLTSYINSYYYDILEKSHSNHQLSGLASHFLGPKAGKLVALNMWVLAFGALMAFVQMAGNFIHTLLPALNPFLASAIFVFVLTFLFLRQGRIWLILLSFLPLLYFIVPALLYFSTLLTQTFPVPSYPVTLHFFGWTMFALSGFTIIPEVKSRQASAIGLTIAAFLYGVFVLCLVFLSGPFLSPDSVSGLAYTHSYLAKGLAIFGLLTLGKGSLNFLKILFDIFSKDLHLPRLTTQFLCLISLFFSLLFLNLSLNKPIQLLATFSTFTSILIIFTIRLKIKTQSRQKITMLFITLLFLLAIFLDIR